MKNYMRVLSTARANGTVGSQPITQIAQQVAPTTTERIKKANSKGNLQQVLAQLQKENADLQAATKTVTRRQTPDYRPPRPLTARETKEKNLADKHKQSRFPDYQTPTYSAGANKIKSSGNGL